MTSEFNKKEREKDLAQAISMKNVRFDDPKHGKIRYCAQHIMNVCRLPRWRAEEIGIVPKAPSEQERRIMRQIHEQQARQANKAKKYAGMIPNPTDDMIKQGRQATLLQRALKSAGRGR